MVWICLVMSARTESNEIEVIEKIKVLDLLSNAIESQLYHLITIHHSHASLKFWIEGKCRFLSYWKRFFEEIQEIFFFIFFDRLSCDNERIFYAALSPGKEFFCAGARDFSEFTKNTKHLHELFSLRRVIEIWYFEFHIILRHLRGELS